MKIKVIDHLKFQKVLRIEFHQMFSQNIQMYKALHKELVQVKQTFRNNHMLDKRKQLPLILEKPMNQSMLFLTTVSYNKFIFVDLKKYPNVFLYLKELFGE